LNLYKFWNIYRSIWIYSKWIRKMEKDKPSYWPDSAHGWKSAQSQLAARVASQAEKSLTAHLPAQLGAHWAKGLTLATTRRVLRTTRERALCENRWKGEGAMSAGFKARRREGRRWRGRDAGGDGSSWRQAGWRRSASLPLTFKFKMIFSAPNFKIRNGALPGL
jgi:hypothetical protein